MTQADTIRDKKAIIFDMIRNRDSLVNQTQELTQAITREIETLDKIENTDSNPPPVEEAFP